MFYSDSNVWSAGKRDADLASVQRQHITQIGKRPGNRENVLQDFPRHMPMVGWQEHSDSRRASFDATDRDRRWRNRDNVYQAIKGLNMSDVPWFAMMVGLIGIAIGWLLFKFDRTRTSDEKWPPDELKTAELRYAEKTFKIWWPIALVARVDRAYALGTEIRLLEFKTRARSVAYLSDVIELSAQRMAIEISTGAKVSKIGYVLTQDLSGKKRSVHRVRLMEKHKLVAAVRRRAGILGGRVEPRYSESAGLCRKCGFQDQCKPELRGGE